MLLCFLQCFVFHSLSVLQPLLWRVDRPMALSCLPLYLNSSPSSKTPLFALECSSLVMLCRMRLLGHRLTASQPKPCASQPKKQRQGQSPPKREEGHSPRGVGATTTRGRRGNHHHQKKDGNQHHHHIDDIISDTFAPPGIFLSKPPNISNSPSFCKWTNAFFNLRLGASTPASRVVKGCGGALTTGSLM